MKCDSCGKFRKRKDLIYVETTDSDGFVSAAYSGYECRYCCSPADERYFINNNEDEE